MLFQFEEELREPIRNWVEYNGFDAKDEVPLCGKIPDIIGLQGSDVEIAIEMKLSNWKRALYQAFIYTNFANKCYIAMPENKKEVIKKNLDEFTKWGIGVLIVDSNDKVNILHHPKDKSLRGNDNECAGEIL